MQFKIYLIFFAITVFLQRQVASIILLKKFLITHRNIDSKHYKEYLLIKKEKEINDGSLFT